MLHPEEDWGGHGFPLPFLAGTCALVSLLRKQLKYISENIFWPCWNCYHKIKSYEGITAQLTVLQNYLQVKISHCLHILTAAQRRWKRWKLAAVKTDLDGE